MGANPRLSCGPNAITNIDRSIREMRYEDATVLGLKMKKRPGAKECRQALAVGKGKEIQS